MNKIPSADVFRRRGLIFVDAGWFDGYPMWTGSHTHFFNNLNILSNIINSGKKETQCYC